jgi:AraC family transcriptional regulator of adaptative response / DNA-3-methyladenine glycosylase II
MNAIPETPQNEIYERARLARDTRFDGQFYVGVRTTGIYCRPICPANAPRSENVTFYASAAAAAEAGFRPCLRCRPESAPGTPAWSGTSTTVRRGLRLISAGALDQDNVEALADRLGVTSRHLRRLFTKHLGASPLAVAHTQRLHFAKRLIDETRLPMNHIAIAAGYGSVRRFNDAFQKTYGRSPRDLRKAGEEIEPVGRQPDLTVRLAARQPFDWSRMIEFLRFRATPGVERVRDDTYYRTVAIDGRHGIVSVRPDSKPGYLSLSLTGIDTKALFETVQTAKEVFDLDAPMADITATLSRDPLLKRLLESSPGVRVPGAWDGFELTVRAILGQQISVKAATTLAGRLADRYGEPLDCPQAGGDLALTRVFPSPARLARARFNNIGLVKSRAATLRALATAVSCGDVSFDAAQEAEDICAALKSIRGIGDWTAQYVSMRALKSPDAFPASDLGLLSAVRMPERVTPAELAARAERWRPWRAYAAILLWGSLAGSGG